MNIVYEENHICNTYDMTFNGHKSKDTNLLLYPRLFNGLEYKKALTKGSYHDKKRFSRNRCLQTHIKKTPTNLVQTQCKPIYFDT